MSVQPRVSQRCSRIGMSVMRRSFVPESFLSEFAGDESQIVDAIVHRDAVEMSDAKTWRHPAVMSLPAPQGGLTGN